MNVYLKIIIVSFFACNLQATLLVVKRENNRFVCLDESDKLNHDAIGDVFLRYQWPMVITNSSLTENEKNELLSSDQEYAEEKFIRKKLQEIDPTYDVVFIPTSLYEMFVVSKYYDDMTYVVQKLYGNLTSGDFFNHYYTVLDDNNTLDQNHQECNDNNTMDQSHQECDDNFLCQGYMLYDEDSFLVQDYIKNYANQDHTEYSDCYIFFRDVYDCFGLIYNACIKYIACSITFNQHNIYLDKIINDRDLTYHEKYEKIHSLFKKINNKYYPETFLYFNNRVTQLLFQKYPNLSLSANGDEISKKIELNLDQITMLFSDNRLLDMGIDFHLISQVMLLEYEARKLNKALLFRGTSKKIQCIEGENITLIDSTMIGSTIYDYSLYTCIEEINQELCSRKDSIEPYSISFGNSLFAGLLHDPYACACKFLKNSGQGYSLFINKKDYMEHQCSDLFYIAPLNTIAGLFGWGEWFHSRSKAAIVDGDQSKYIHVHGILSNGLMDKANIILVTRDPFEHAELFSQYLADNMRYIERFADDCRSQEMINYAANQKTAAQYYFILKTLHELGF